MTTDKTLDAIRPSEASRSQAMALAKRAYYLCFTKDHDRNLAIKTFVKKFGKPPEKIFVENRVLWLGPALEK